MICGNVDGKVLVTNVLCLFAVDSVGHRQVLI